MGNIAATPPSPSKVCESCEAQKAKAKPPASKLTRGTCLELYKVVEDCMNTNNGQINLCQKEWTAFRACHEAK